MLSIPQKGFAPSVNVNNVSQGIFADWIEANLLFANSEISIGEIVKVLIEEQICKERGQDPSTPNCQYRLGGNRTKKKLGWNPIGSNCCKKSYPYYSQLERASNTRIFCYALAANNLS